MNKKSYELFKSSTVEEIVKVLVDELKLRHESPFWANKVEPFSRAILSILIPLRDENMLFDPEGKAISELTPELFLIWSDFVSLKTLAFTIQKSNDESELLRTSLDIATCQRYKKLDLDLLGNYLSSYNVNLDNEALDFPISSYNLHQGVSNVIKSLLI